MAARYLYRMDDITPGMSWPNFWRFLDLFRSHGVRPLLGVVPRNADPKLTVGPVEPRFWEILRELVRDGAVEIAQHGCTHVYDSDRYGILGRRFGFRRQSEFAGHPLDVQRERILLGQAILRDQGLPTDVWMAPSHSFDAATLRALRETGFGAVTDGVALFPFRDRGLVFVPQQLWRPKAFPVGIWTICLHANTIDEGFFDLIRSHVAAGTTFLSFSEARRECAGLVGRISNRIFEETYVLNLARHRLRRRLSAADEIE